MALPPSPLGEEDGDKRFCAFHTETDVSADQQQEELLKALDEAGDRSRDKRPEHRGQFVGATFGAINLSSETITATDNYDIRFDHAQFQAEDEYLNFENTRFETQGRHPVSFVRAEFITDGDGDVVCTDTIFRTNGDGSVRFSNATFRTSGDGDVMFDNPTFRTDGTGTDLRNANIAGVSVNGETTCKRLYEGYGADRSLLRCLRRLFEGPQFDSEDWDATAQAYHRLKTVFSDHGLVGKARSLYVRERRARSLEAKAEDDRLKRRYLRSLPPRIFTGYGIQISRLVFWMGLLFLISTRVYEVAGVNETLLENVSYSVLAFTVAPPHVPEGVGTQIVMMVETFFGTLSIVLLGYILGNRERF